MGCLVTVVWAVLLAVAVYASMSGEAGFRSVVVMLGFALIVGLVELREIGQRILGELERPRLERELRDEYARHGLDDIDDSEEDLDA